MQTFNETVKKDILKGFEKRKFELIELLNAENLPWWIEEKWILSGLKSSNRNNLLIVIFLTEKHWESGKKIVDEVLVTNAEMENYSDYSSKVTELDMRKGNFADKLEQFWTKLDKN